MMTPRAEELLTWLKKHGRPEKVGRRTLKVVLLQRGLVELCERADMSRRTLYNVLPILEKKKLVRKRRLPRMGERQPIRLEVME